jgi:hypothetical protein
MARQAQLIHGPALLGHCSGANLYGSILVVVTFNVQVLEPAAAMKQLLGLDLKQVS